MICLRAELSGEINKKYWLQDNADKESWRDLVLFFCVRRDAYKNNSFHVRFRHLRISKIPANAHEMNYFYTLCIGSGNV